MSVDSFPPSEQTDGAARTAQSLFAAAFRSSPAAISIVRASDGRFVDVNDNFVRLLGYSRAELIERAVPEMGIYVDPADRARVFALLEAQGTVKDQEVRLRRKSGEVLNVLLSVERFTVNAETYLLGMSFDITERKRIEEEILRRNQQLAALNQMGQAFSRLTEPGAIPELMHTMIGQALDNRHFFIALHDESSQQITYPIFIMGGERQQRSPRPFMNGVTEHVIREKKPLRIGRDLQGELERLRVVSHVGLPRSLLAVPMRIGEQVLGAITVMDYEQESAYDASHEELLVTFATQAAIALENARLFQETKRLLVSEKRQRRIADTLAHAVSRMSGSLSEAQIQEAIIDELFHYLMPDQINLYEWRLAEQAFRVNYWQVVAPEVAEDNYAVGQWIPAAERADLRAVMAENQARVKATVQKDYLTHEHILMPWRAGGEAAGVIEIFHTAARSALVAEDQALCESIIQQAAIAIEKARLYAQLEQRVSERTAELSEANRRLTQEIAERKQAEEARLALERQMLETQKLESLGVLAGGIAHDFNNLLVSVLGNAGLALLELPPTAAAREYIAQIEIAAKHASDLTSQMLAYSGKAHFIIRAIQLNALIEEMAPLLSASISKNAVLRYDLRKPLPLIEADAAQLRQVVMNLVTNASDAIGNREGMITIATDRVQADRALLNSGYLGANLPEGDYVSLTVSDSGSGMDAATQAKMFEPFFTTKATGRGLGLSAVLGIVRGHKGMLKVQSEAGRGTTFTIFLPRTPQPTHTAPSTGDAQAAEWRGQGTVLVVDDETGVRTVVERMLKRFGFEILHAADGREGLEVLRAHADRIACILLDMTMPHLNGEATFREIRRINPAMRVVLMSGYSEQEARQRFEGLGLAGFLQKPFTLADLRDKLQTALDDG